MPSLSNATGQLLVPAGNFTMQDQSTEKRTRSNPFVDDRDSNRKESSPERKKRRRFRCDICEVDFTEERALTRHTKEAKKHRLKSGSAAQGQRRCPVCDKCFVRAFDVQRHHKEVHVGVPRRQPSRTKNQDRGKPDILPHRIDGQYADSASADPRQTIPENDETLRASSESTADVSGAAGFFREAKSPRSTPQVGCAIFCEDICDFVMTGFASGIEIIVTEDDSCKKPDGDSVSRSEITVVDERPENRESTTLNDTSNSNSSPLSDLDGHELDQLLSSVFDRLHMSDSLETKLRRGGSKGGLGEFGKTFSALKQCPLCRQHHLEPGHLAYCMCQHMKDPSLRIHICEVCEFGFARHKDLDAHVYSAERHGNCGFKFEHVCSGHHPPWDPNHRHMNMWYLMQLHIKASKTALTFLRPKSLMLLVASTVGDGEGEGAGGRWSLADLHRMSRRSWLSLTSSLNSSWTMPERLPSAGGDGTKGFLTQILNRAPTLLGVGGKRGRADVAEILPVIDEGLVDLEYFLCMGTGPGKTVEYP